MLISKPPLAMRQLRPRSTASYLRLLLAAKRYCSASPSQGERSHVLDQVNEVGFRLTPANFQSITATAENNLKAVVFRRQATTRAFPEPDAAIRPPVSLPALTAWFDHDDERGRLGFSEHFRKHLDHTVPYECIFNDGDGTVRKFMKWLESTVKTAEGNELYKLLHRYGFSQQSSNSKSEFIRFNAPLALLNKAIEFNRHADQGKPLSGLYIAQAALSDLPHELQLDVPLPDLLTAPITPETPYVCDIYNSSLWLGLEPTFTPWHRDPNHNLFCQLAGAKRVRLLPPKAGSRVFRKVMENLGNPSASAAIRGEEMMQTTEREAWREAVWGPGAPHFMLEATVNAGDMLFIPKGWWHSVQSTGGERGALNVSVNWWFRWRNPTLSYRRS